MKQLKTIRLVEAMGIPAIILVYIVRRMIMEDEALCTLLLNGHKEYGIAWHSYVTGFAKYSQVLNMHLPILGGGLLFIASWLVMHFLAVPRFFDKGYDNKRVVYAALSLLLAVLAVFVFLYFRQYVRYTLSSYGLHTIGPNGTRRWGRVFDGFITYSLYRKKTWLADLVAVYIVFGLYEWLAQGYYWLLNYADKKEDGGNRENGHFNFQLGNLIPVAFFCILLFFALFGTLPEQLWSWGHASRNLFLSGCVLLLLVVQELMYTSLFNRKGSIVRFDLVVNFLIILVISGSGVVLLVLALAHFQLQAFINTGRVLIPAPFLVIVFIALAVARVRWDFQKKQAALHTQVSATSAELASLQAQLNPHFLFNALNSLYTAALQEGSEKTADGIQKLGDMMRFLLHENNRERISLSKEIAYLENYIAIQRIRIDESQGIDIRVTIQHPEREIYIAPMMLVPFVENAFKHGISHIEPSWIHITLTADETALYFTVNNSLHARQENDPEEMHSGVGLENVKKRLGLIYANRHSLKIKSTAQEYFAELKLTYW